MRTASNYPPFPCQGPLTDGVTFDVRTETGVSAISANTLEAEPPEVIVPAATATVPAAANYDPAGPDRDCGHFQTHEQAQAFFVAAGGPDRDPHRLDGDNDGIACESLPRENRP